MSEPVIEAREIRKCYGDFTAVDGISFSVDRGELFGLLGPNGAGKTSTIRMIYGYSPLGGGSLRVFGQDITTQWRSIRARRSQTGLYCTGLPGPSVWRFFQRVGWIGVKSRFSKSSLGEPTSFTFPQDDVR